MTNYITESAFDAIHRDTAIRIIQDAPPRNDADAVTQYYTNESGTHALECTQDDIDEYDLHLDAMNIESDILPDHVFDHLLAWLLTEERVCGECTDGPVLDTKSDILGKKRPTDSVWDAITEAFGEEGACAVRDDTLERLQAMPTTSVCGRDCKLAIDGVAKMLATLGMGPPSTEANAHPRRDFADDVIRTCVRAVEVMVCG